MTVNCLLGQKRKLSPDRGRTDPRPRSQLAAVLRFTPFSLTPSPWRRLLGHMGALLAPLLKLGDDPHGPLCLPQTELGFRRIMGGSQEELRIPGPAMAVLPEDRSGREVFSRPLDICLAQEGSKNHPCHRPLSWPSPSQSSLVPATHENHQLTRTQDTDVQKGTDFQI